jgi:hypothetical protein
MTAGKETPPGGANLEGAINSIDKGRYRMVRSGSTAADRLVSYKNKRPLLRGFLVGNLVYVHCPWCDKMHIHGWNPEDNARAVTPRYAHCHSQGAPGSYWISLFRKSSLKTIERDQEQFEIAEQLRQYLHDKRTGGKEGVK